LPQRVAFALRRRGGGGMDAHWRNDGNRGGETWIEFVVLASTAIATLPSSGRGGHEFMG